MPEVRGIQATEDVKEEWIRAYHIYLSAPGDPYDAKKDRTERINHVANEMNIKRKQAKRRVRNYEAWYRNMKKGKVVMAENFASLPEARPMPPNPRSAGASRGNYGGQGRGPGRDQWRDQGRSHGGSQGWRPRDPQR